MNILLTIHHHLDVGAGAPGADTALGRAISQLNHSLQMLSHDNLPKWAQGGASICLFPLLVAKKASFERHRYDVLDFASYDGWLAANIPRAFRTPIIAFHSHGLEHVLHDRFIEDCRRGAQRKSWKYPLFRGSILLWQVTRAARGADVCIFLNEEERELAIVKLGVSPEKTELTINAIDSDLLHRVETLTLGKRENFEPLNIAFIGTYVERKGISYLVPALESYLSKNVTARALLLGTGNEAARVLADFSASIRDRVEVIPQFNKLDLPTLLSNSHIFLLPSLSEGFAISGLEAMVCGLVPVVTRGHGFEAYVSDGENGVLIDRANVTQIELALEKLNSDRTMWHRLREAAQAKAKTFTWERAAKMRLEMYERAAQRIASKRTGMFVQSWIR